MAKSLDTNYLYKLSKNDGMDDEVKPWYHRTYPDDTIWKDFVDDINFKDIYLLLIGWIPNIKVDDIIYNSTQIDSLYGDDSIARERVFDKISELTNLKYDIIYKYWRNL